MLIITNLVFMMHLFLAIDKQETLDMAKTKGGTTRPEGNLPGGGLE